MLSRRFSLFVLVVLFASACAFAPRTTTSRSAVATTSSSTQLAERQWNFNEGRSPWGLKKNAEIWNGRIAQVCIAPSMRRKVAPRKNACSDKCLMVHLSLFCCRWHLCLSFCKNLSQERELFKVFKRETLSILPVLALRFCRLLD